VSKEFYDDCVIGEVVRTQGRTMTEADIVAFAAMSGDWNPIHVDEEFARQTPLGGRIAHGLLALVTGMGLMSNIGIHTIWPRSLLTITSIDKVRFVAPVRIGDTLHVEAEIDELKPMADDRGLITTRMRIRNQREESIITLRVQLMAGRRPGAAA
jgi:3-hydroxybutyryl-CoA dehydratase